jgi:hypothetical protein
MMIAPLNLRVEIPQRCATMALTTTTMGLSTARTLSSVPALISNSVAERVTRTETGTPIAAINGARTIHHVPMWFMRFATTRSMMMATESSTVTTTGAEVSPSVFHKRYAATVTMTTAMALPIAPTPIVQLIRVVFHNVRIALTVGMMMVMTT